MQCKSVTINDNGCWSADMMFVGDVVGRAMFFLKEGEESVHAMVESCDVVSEAATCVTVRPLGCHRSKLIPAARMLPAISWSCMRSGEIKVVLAFAGSRAG